MALERAAAPTTRAGDESDTDTSQGGEEGSGVDSGVEGEGGDLEEPAARKEKAPGEVPAVPKEAAAKLKLNSEQMLGELRRGGAAFGLQATDKHLPGATKHAIPAYKEAGLDMSVFDRDVRDKKAGW